MRYKLNVSNLIMSRVVELYFNKELAEEKNDLMLFCLDNKDLFSKDNLNRLFIKFHRHSLVIIVIKKFLSLLEQSERDFLINQYKNKNSMVSISIQQYKSISSLFYFKKDIFKRLTNFFFFRLQPKEYGMSLSVTKVFLFYIKQQIVFFELHRDLIEIDFLNWLKKKEAEVGRVYAVMLDILRQDEQKIENKIIQTKFFNPNLTISELNNKYGLPGIRTSQILSMYKQNLGKIGLQGN